jgi:RNA polymerase sigma-70 factor (ECF subfamily)
MLAPPRRAKLPEDIGITLQLVRRVQGGDHDALQPLFERYYERVRRIVRVRLGAPLRSRLDSGDIVQETFLAALKGFDRFDLRDEAALIHWLSVLAENRIRDAADYNDAAKRAAGREVPLASPGRSGTVHLDPASDGTGPADRAANDEQVERLEEAISALPEDLREIVLLRDYAGMAWEDIATRVGRPSPDAARMAHGKALLLLAAHMRERGEPAA